MSALPTDALRGDGVQLTDWIADPDGDYCSMRCIAGTDPSQIENRVAFIEKTPRVRVKAYAGESGDSQGWHACRWKGDGGWDEHSQGWCDSKLVSLGYIVPNPKPYVEES